MVPMSGLHWNSFKETNPVDVAEYVTACGIEKDLVFVWWVRYTLSNCDVIVSEVSL